jgi:hypothetical protein
MEEDQLQDDQNWRSDTSDKWDMIVSGKWIQKVVWNSSDTGHLHMDNGLSDKRRGGTKDGIKHPDGIYELCKRCREMGLKMLCGRHTRDTTGYL